ncbi:MAG: hypothetical protein GYA33_11620, partial [Thermogutta sp.]|nr:hypothetical protein [Thermogutta sp.]
MAGELDRQESERPDESAQAEPQPLPAEAGLRRHRLFLPSVALIAAAVVLAVLTHGYWLPAAAAPLLARPIPPGFAPTAIWIHSGDGHSLPGQDMLDLLAD